MGLNLFKCNDFEEENIFFLPQLRLKLPKGVKKIILEKSQKCDQLNIENIIITPEILAKLYTNHVKELEKAVLDEKKQRDIDILNKKIPRSKINIKLQEIIATEAYKTMQENNGIISKNDFYENIMIYEEYLLILADSLKFNSDEYKNIIVSSQNLKEQLLAKYQMEPELIEVIEADDVIYIFKIHENHERKLDFEIITQNNSKKMPEDLEEILNENADFNADILNTVAEIIQHEKPYYQLKIKPEERHFIIGDIHADSISLKNILTYIYTTSLPSKTNIFFLGDYLDRGTNDLTVLNYIFKLKIKYPKKIYLLKGNHEDYFMDQDTVIPHFSPADFFDSYHQAFQEINADKKLFIDIFSKLPISVKLKDSKGKDTLLIHGGIPQRYFLQSFDTFEDIIDKSTQYYEEGKIEKDILSSLYWNDPSEVDMPKNIRQKRGMFSQKDYDYVLKKYGIVRIVRGHQYDEKEKKGYKINFKNNENEIITIFSTGKNSPESYYESVENACFAEIFSEGEITIKILS